MKRIFSFCIALLGAAATSAAAAYGIDGNNVTISLGSKGTVRLQVINSNIIRVEATPEGRLPQKQSLIIVPQQEYKKFKVEENGNAVIVSTDSIAAKVSKSDGQVVFVDHKGRIILSETKGGRTFTKYRVPDREIGRNNPDDNPATLLTEEQRTKWSWQQKFDSPASEIFHGLGQHQAEEYNYKGKNEELFQYNTKVSVPFVMSNRGYALLWDSYSLGRWGNPSPYMQLYQVFKLYDKDGKAGAITASYTDKKGNNIVRQEDSIYYEDIFEIKKLPDIDLSSADVEYSGYIEASETREYHFILYYAGYIKVSIDGQEVVKERWRTAWNPNAYKFKCRLEKGKKTPLKIQWQPDGGQSYCGLRAANPKTEIPDNEISIFQEADKDMDYYFIAGANADSLIKGYRTLTGKAPIYPKWALGFWQSRERYKTSEELTSTVAEFRRRHLPIDNIVQDWFYWKEDEWGSHVFDQQRYPDPQAMLDSIHKMHGRFMISVWPKFYNTTKNYKELTANRWMYCQAVKDSIKDWVGPGYIAGFYDAYAAGARKMFWRQMDENLYTKYNHGIDAWWMDASEPNVRDCTPIWYRKALCGPTALGSSSEYFNAYSLVNADAIYNGQRSSNPNARVFLLTRSGFAGLQRYSTATWSGDIATRWEDMRAQITAGLNYSMCGLPFWGQDQGGFCVENRYMKAQGEYDKTGKENADLEEWRELQCRWTQAGAFTPLFRVHGQWPTREIWNIAPENHPAYQSFAYYDSLRYRLMPYLYSISAAVHFDDYTMMRGLIMDFPNDPNLYSKDSEKNASGNTAAGNGTGKTGNSNGKAGNGSQEIGVDGWSNQWMFGPALMACPVTEYKVRSREVYLPSSSGWYDFYTGKYFRGGATIEAEAPYTRIPVYVRDGSILPVGPDMQWSDEKPADTISLYIFEGRNGSFKLYEDEGTNYNYERGLYSVIPLSYDNASRTLVIGRRQGSFPGMLRNRTFILHFITPTSPLHGSNKPQVIKYNGEEVKAKM